MSKTQIIVIAVCVVGAIVGVLVFAGIFPGSKQTSGGVGAVITIWGTFPQDKVSSAISDLNTASKDLFQITYVEKKADTYDNDIVEALAAGRGPDAWFVSQEGILKSKDKILSIPFASYPERDFRTAFIDSAELFIDAQNQSIIGAPVLVDPLVMYWNKDLFSSAGIARAPSDWDEFTADSKILTKKDAGGNIILSGSALGEVRNIRNAKEILSMLFLQAGNKIVDASGEKLETTIGDNSGAVENALKFFNEFSNPAKTNYSWNKALSDSRAVFLNGSLAMYFGYASEYEALKTANPHLNFDIAEVPQIKDGKLKAVFGKTYGLVISKSSTKSATAFSGIFALAGADASAKLSQALGIGSAERTVLAGGSADPILSVIYKSSVMARAWLDPDPQATYDIFKDMVELTGAGRANFYEVMRNAENKMEALIK